MILLSIHFMTKEEKWVYESGKRNISSIYEIFKPIGDYNIQKLILSKQVVVTI